MDTKREAGPSCVVNFPDDLPPPVLSFPTYIVRRRRSDHEVSIG